MKGNQGPWSLTSQAQGGSPTFIQEQCLTGQQEDQEFMPCLSQRRQQADEPKMAVLVGATPALRLWTCECWASWELSFELH